MRGKMGNINLTAKDEGGFYFLEVTIGGDGLCTPSDLKYFKLPESMKDGDGSGKGVVISGKAPIWVYGRLTGMCHMFAWVATHDPRLGAAIVTETHIRTIKIADRVIIPQPVVYDVSNGIAVYKSIEEASAEVGMEIEIRTVEGGSAWLAVWPIAVDQPALE